MQQTSDQLIRLICESLKLRIYAAATLECVRSITSLHRTTPNATVALGRSITATALMSATLKMNSEQSVTLKIEGSGPLKLIHVQADAKGNIRGYVGNPLIDQGHNIGGINFSRAIGAGFLTVRKDIGLREPYSGIIPLTYGDIAADLAFYLTSSEQIPSAVVIALTIDPDGTITSSGGILIQTLPDTPPESIEAAEHSLLSGQHSLGGYLKRGDGIIDAVRTLLGGSPISVLSTHPLRPSCRCSKSRIRSILAAMPREELDDMRRRDKGAEVTCTFCTKRYRFSEKELERIILSTNNSKPHEPDKTN